MDIAHAVKVDAEPEPTQNRETKAIMAHLLLDFEERKATTSLEAMDTSRSLLLSLAALALLGPAVTSAFYRGRPGSSLALAKRLETELAEDEEYTALPGTLEAFEWRSRFPPALPADVSSFYPFFRPASLAKKNKDAPRSLDPAGANRKFQTQGWRR
ncbi:uncharacterized protein [Dermacentor andersoni]|uniref:uncharacterized protein isoform X2 n=1 Tax=Dermacentor andersoni TaxID=34620 RepID=UPI003B3BBCD2